MEGCWSLQLRIFRTPPTAQCWKDFNIECSLAVYTKNVVTYILFTNFNSTFEVYYITQKLVLLSDGEA
jgi:hypothetical protein